MLIVKAIFYELKIIRFIFYFLRFYAHSSSFSVQALAPNPQLIIFLELDAWIVSKEQIFPVFASSRSFTNTKNGLYRLVFDCYFYNFISF